MDKPTPAKPAPAKPIIGTCNVETFNSLIVYHEQAYRTAGLRPPVDGELYMTREGRISTYDMSREFITVARVIVRPCVSMAAAYVLHQALGEILECHIHDSENTGKVG